MKSFITRNYLPNNAVHEMSNKSRIKWFNVIRDVFSFIGVMWVLCLIYCIVNAVINGSGVWYD